MTNELREVPFDEARKSIKAPRGTDPDTYYREHAHEVWTDGNWAWYVLKKYQKNDDALYARWFCLVDGFYSELGDVYVADIKKQAWRVR